MLAGLLRGHWLGDLPPPNLNPASQVYLENKHRVTPHRGIFQGLGARGKQRGMCRVSLGCLCTPMVIPSMAPEPAGPRGSREAGKVGGAWEEARYVHACHEEDRTQQISASRRDPRGRGCSRKMAISGRASSAARQPW